MAKILQMPVKRPVKLGFQRASKNKAKDPEQHGQLNLFGSKKGRILDMPPRLSPFEKALLLDEYNDPRAIEYYHQAIEAEDCIADAYCNLGILESKAGHIKKAFNCFTRSLKIEARHLESHYNLGNLYFDIENLRLARQHYEIASEIDSNFANIYFNLGLVLALNEEFSSAIEALSHYKKLVSKEEGKVADDLLSTLKSSLAAQR